MLGGAKAIFRPPEEPLIKDGGAKTFKEFGTLIIPWQLPLTAYCVRKMNLFWVKPPVGFHADKHSQRDTGGSSLEEQGCLKGPSLAWL